jgi:hypothetical protein
MEKGICKYRISASPWRLRPSAIVSSLSDAEAGLVNASLFDDFQNSLTSSKKEL